MYDFLMQLAIILLAAKVGGLLFRKIGFPQVAGEIIAGLILGPSILNLFQINDYVTMFAEIGVILLMFTTGLETNIKQLIKTGPVAFAMACIGVAFPLLLGYILYSVFYGFAAIGSTEFFTAVFMGTIMTATSVSITVAVLQELGKISSEIGTTIVSAAIIDDVIGIIVLTCVIGAGTGSGDSILMVLIKTVVFFLFATVFGYLVNHVIEFIDKIAPHTQRIPIFSLSFCLILSYLAETKFGIADITGAYIAGVALCNVDDAKYIERKMDISAYMMFAPVFFVAIGLKTDLRGITPEILLFSIAFVVVALVSKIIGCGAIAKISGFDWSDSMKAGIGMMTRGEVALIVAQKGLQAGLVDSIYFSAVILLIIISSVLTPFCLKMLFSRDEKNGKDHAVKAA